MNALKLPPALQKLIPRNDQVGLRRAWLLALIFFCGALAICLHRYFTFYASYDHGLFNQLFWNNLHGHWFQSSLTSANSVAALEDNAIPTVSFVHLGQHLVLTFLLWLPLYAVFPHPITLIVLQVGLMTIGGLLLYALARQYLAPQLSVWITGSYYGAIAVVAPTLANFYEHCQIPVFMFGTMLAFERQRWGWFWLCAILVLGLREDAGIILFGFGVYMIVSRRKPWMGVLVCLVSFGYAAFVTNVIQPMFSDDVSRLYLANRFKQFVDTENPTTLEVLWGMISHPIRLFRYLFVPFNRRFDYLLGQWVPLAFVPALSGVAWTIAGFPLLALFSQTGMTALSIQIRYAIAIVPGIFYGAILWWSVRPHRFTPKFRRFWQVCLALSFIFIIAMNPNRSLSFIIPDSVRPWVFVPLTRQWEHAGHINNVIRNVPDQVSVTTTTHLIPQLSTRRAIVRLPQWQIYDDRNQKVMIEYAVADLWQLQEYSKAFKDSRDFLRVTLAALEILVTQKNYGVLQVEDGVVMVAKDQSSKPDALVEWQKLAASLKGNVELER